MDTNRLQPAGARRPLIRRGAVELGAALGLALTVLLTAALWYGEQTRAAVCADTLRLHILANSNSVDDQLLKLKVRDAVLEEMPAILQNAATKQEAETAVSGALWRLQQVAQRAVRRTGSSQTVRVRLEQADFAARDYGSFRLPAGEYTALRIELGAAAGHNWFCVLYPELCVGASQARYDTPPRTPWCSAGSRCAPLCGTSCSAWPPGRQGRGETAAHPRAGADACIRPPPGFCG